MSAARRRRTGAPWRLGALRLAPSTLPPWTLALVPNGRGGPQPAEATGEPARNGVAVANEHSAGPATRRTRSASPGGSGRPGWRWTWPR